MHLFFSALFIVHACLAGTIPATPENITITFLTPTAVRVSWQTMLNIRSHPIDKYVVTYKPTDDRVVKQVAGNSEAVILDRLSPSTEYSIGVTAIWLGKKYRSRQIVFKTLESPKILPHQDSGMPPHQLGIYHEDVLTIGSNLTNSTVRELPTIRGVEVGIVLIVLMVWVGAVALFFNRWGKIRMLLPYQPDFKHDQLKVPGASTCSGGTCSGSHSHQNSHYLQEAPSLNITERCTRNRFNSAIFVATEDRGFDSVEFLRRHGSQSVLCRKARSAENICDENRTNNYVHKRQWQTEDGASTMIKEISNQAGSIESGEFSPIPNTKQRSQFNQTEISRFLEVQENASDAANKNIPSTIPPPLLIASGFHSATITTANAVVGSILLETPPPHLRHQQTEYKVCPKNDIAISKESTAVVKRQKKNLVHQKSTSHAPTTGYILSPSCSPCQSPIFNNLKTQNMMTQLPTLSISEPSPHETQEFL